MRDKHYKTKSFRLSDEVIKELDKRIIDYKLNEEEQAAFNKSADAVRNMNDVLSTLSL